MRNKILLFFCTILVGFWSFAQPTISSFSPTSGYIGTPVTITGTNFSTNAANNIVYFGSVKANVTSASNTSLVVTVPAGTTQSPISVTTNGLTCSSQLPFSIQFGSSTINTSSFSNSANQRYNTGFGPCGIVVVDLDGDGKSDLVTANNSNSPSSTIQF